VTSLHQPWRPGDTPAVLALNVLAAAGVAACWFGSAREIHFHDTLYWLQGAIVAVIVAGVGDGLWLLAGMRRIRERRRVLIETWPRQPVVASTAEEAVVTAPRMTTYHRPGCLLVLGKKVRSGSSGALAARQLTPCGMCRP
jgi:hypothetical protein